MADIERQRQELSAAEQLFNLPMTPYPELFNVQKEMKSLDQIYEIYHAQKVNQGDWNGIPLYITQSISRKHERTGQKLCGKIWISKF